MRTGQSGRIAIFWRQTEIDGLEAAPLSFLSVGAAWSWRGQARFLKNSSVQMLEGAEDIGSDLATLSHCVHVQNLSEEASGLLVLTNGAQTFTAALFPVAGESAPMLVFEGDCPERDQDFWISEFAESAGQGNEATGMDETVIAFPSRSTPVLDDQDQQRAVSVGRRAD